MRFLVHSMQRPGLTPAETARLYAAMRVFYGDVPRGVTLECDYVRDDRRGSYSVLDVPDRATLDRILAPFAGLVDVDVVPVLTAAEAMGGP
jgi:hypothetical protein